MHRCRILLLTLFFLGCDNAKDSNEEPPEASSTQSAPGSLAIGTEVSQNLGQVNDNLELVQNNLGPPPLGTLNLGTQDQGSGLNILALSDEANEVKISVKGSIEGTMRALGWIRSVINSLQPQIEGKSDKSGTIDMGFAKISFEFETKEKYKIRDIGGESGNYHIEVDNNHYILYRTPPENVDSNKVGDNKIEVTYQDEDNWSLRDDNTWPDCNANRPEILTSYVERTSGIWHGKFAYGNGSINFKCPEEIAGKNYTYFQFVGSEVATTAAGYSDVPLGFTDFSNIEQYAMSDDSNQSVNPVCILEDVDPTPQATCDSENSDIKNAKFGLEDKWVTPDDITQIIVNFPSGF